MAQRKICLRSGRIYRTWRIERGKVNSELAPFVQLAVDVDKASMAFHYRQRSGKAKTCALRHLFGREKWFEDPALNLLSHPWSGIRHADNHKASCLGLNMHARIVFIYGNILRSN